MEWMESGNLLESKAQALVNTVNTVGVMGKGIALQFKQMFPSNFQIYAKACREKQLTIGQLLITEENHLLGGKKLIINFPTKTHWRKPSEYAYVEAGLVTLVKEIEARNIRSIAIPALGAGNGGLDWNVVKPLIEKHLAGLDCEIFVYPPQAFSAKVSLQVAAQLTPARAMLLSVLYEVVRNGEFISEFAAEKVAYFLQRFGAEDDLKLHFHANYYGPFSGQVKHVLKYFNGSYIRGYDDKTTKPFDALDLISSEKHTVDAFFEQEENQHYLEIVRKTKDFLNGFYSTFGLELLSSIDYLRWKKNVTKLDEVQLGLANWSDRKRNLAENPQFIQTAIEHLEKNLAIGSASAH